MPRIDPDGTNETTPAEPPAPPPVTPPPAPAPVAPPPAPAPGAEPRNANGETLAQAEQAVLDEVAAGALGAAALARHPLPPGTSAVEALRFLASLPQTSYSDDSSGGTVTGPPLGTLPPATLGAVEPSQADPAGEPGPIPTDDDYAQWEIDAAADAGGTRELQAVTQPRPGTIIGTPYAGTHGKAFNQRGGSDNWQSENAVDVWLHPGTAIVAGDAGTISPAGWGFGPSGQGGRFAGERFHLVTHTAPFVYFGTHLRKLVVKAGQRVTKGQLIGYSGIANGVPHLHFAVPPGYDPAAYVRDFYSLDTVPVGTGGAPPPPAPGPTPVEIETLTARVEDAYNGLARVAAYTLPDATVHLRAARRSLGDAVS